MILIADSGSSQCDWRLISLDGKERYPFSTVGINPYFHDEDFIRRVIEKETDLVAHRDNIKAIFFYGAGCSSRRLKQIVEIGLYEVFPKAEIYVDHDMIAAAFAVYDEEACIACILGTGSNSCHFDGDIVREEVPALAYILGDEGSGSYFGKKLLAAYLYKKLPENMYRALQDEYKLSKDMVMQNTYMRPHANVYLASFMPFITRFRDEPYVRDMVAAGLEEFMRIHVQCYKDYPLVKTHFIGSIARYHEDLLREVAVKLNIQVGQVILQPIEPLVDYHLKYYIPKMKFK